MEKGALWLLMFLGSFSAAFMTTISDYQPQQVHIAVGETSEDMVITWVTPDHINDHYRNSSVVEYGTKDIDSIAIGNATKFIDGGDEKRHMWIHRVTLKGLTPDTRYFYHCGSSRGWSSIYTFKTWKDGTDWPVRIAMYGDLGVGNARSLEILEEEVVHGLYDAVIHVGDFAYNMDTDNARVGDQFMRQIEPIAAYLPYMTCPGNHERAYNFSNYKARFTMPRFEETENMFYSWNIGPVHFISVNTEAYYYLGYGLDPLSNMWQWLVQDLEEATRPEVRAQRPWIILYGHRPMYCTTLDMDDCFKKNCTLRVGLSGEYGMEELLYSYGVDLAVWAHEHSYERLYPLYQYTVLNGSVEAPYTNPKGPVHFTTGSAGCSEKHSFFIPLQFEWSAFRSVMYGYTRITVHNDTHLYWEQTSDAKDGEVIDSVWLIRDEHVPYPDVRSADF